MKIPLWNRGGEIIKYAIVDKQDYEFLNTKRWSLQATGYPQAYHEGHTRTMHQIILNLKPGYRNRDIEVSHLDQNKLNNRRKNLKVSNRQENSRNQNEAQKNNRTGYLNVQLHHKNPDGNYCYTVGIFGKYYGHFWNAKEAGEFAKRKRKEILTTSN